MTWKTNLGIRVALSAGLTALALARAAHGAEPVAPLPGAPATPSKTAALTPPRLVKFVDAMHPPAAKVAGRAAAVDLELGLDSAGKVTDAKVVTPIGDGFDEAAVSAAQQFQFEPARRGDQAIAARIRYRYVFELAAPAAPSTGALGGRVLMRGGDDQVLGAEVTITSADGNVTRTAATAPDGSFTFGDLPPGSYRLRVAGTDLQPVDVKESVTAGDVTSVTYRLAALPTSGKAPAGELEFGATATIEAPPREVTKRSLSGDELLRVAGTRGDPLRAIEYMPGVGRSPQAEFIIIRGSSPSDSEVQFEGAPINRLYHFGGLTSFVQPRLIEKIDLYPGNFSARFGRKMGGIVDVAVRDPKTDALHGMVDVNLVDSSFFVEGPVARNWSFAVAAKRSYIDLFIEKLVPKDEAQITAAPVYWDYQAMLAYKPSSKDRFRAMVYGSYDDLKLILAHPADNDPAIRGGISSNSAFHRAQLIWQHKYNDAIEHEINVSTGPFSFDENVGPDLKAQIPGYDAFLRSEWRARLTDQLRLLGGLDISYNWFDFSYKGPSATQLDGDPDSQGTLSGRKSVELDHSYSLVRPAAYLEAVWQATQRLTLVPGARVDYLGDVKRWTFDPRVTARYELTATTVVKGGVGLFSQAPSGAESLPVLGNPHIRPSRAEHYSFGVEQEVGTRLKLTAEGFYKRLSALTVNSPVPGENLNNDGIGRIYGGEGSAKLRPTAKSSGFVSYTLSRSERNDHGTEWRLFSWDQTHILTVAGAYRLGRNWDLSGTFRYVTGNPITPVAGGIYNANSDMYKPLYGGINSDRSNAFHRLDLRIEKTWHPGAGTIAGYLDVQNAYDRHNEEGRTNNYNFTQTGVISGLPILPSLGIRGEI